MWNLVNLVFVFILVICWSFIFDSFVFVVSLCSGNEKLMLLYVFKLKLNLNENFIDLLLVFLINFREFLFE